jgi:hypothetical protein
LTCKKLLLKTVNPLQKNWKIWSSVCLITYLWIGIESNKHFYEALCKQWGFIWTRGDWRWLIT